MKQPTSRSASAWLHGVLLAGVLLAELWFFTAQVSRHHAWVYPRWNDQIQYLTEAYQSYETLRRDGWWAGLRESVLNPAAQGTLHDPLAVIVFGVTGPSRTAALGINLGAFLVWQLTAFLAWRRLSGRWSVAWLAAGLLLTIRTLVEPDAGTPIDFRLDWLGCCVTGIALNLGAFTDGFVRRRASVLFGVAVGLAILTRFLTVVYFAGAFGLVLLWLLLQLLRPGRAANARRLLNLALAGAAAALVALPLLWLHREWVYNYYWIGHLTGPESAIRNPNFGLTRSLQFIFNDALLHFHLGQFAVRTAGVLAGALALLALTRRWWRGLASQPVAVEPVGSTRAFVGLGATFLVVAGTVLVLHGQKSHLVVSILLPSTAILAVAVLHSLSRWLPETRASAAALGVLAAGALLAGGWHYQRGLARMPHNEQFAAGARKVGELADYVFAISRAAGLTHPRIGVDQITDSLDAQITRVVSYERSGTWVPYIMTLPTGIAEDKPEVLMNQLANSDFVFLTEEMPGEGHWPYDRQMRRLYPELKAWCDANLRLVETFPLFDRRMTLYQRKELTNPPGSP